MGLFDFFKKNDSTKSGAIKEYGAKNVNLSQDLSNNENLNMDESDSSFYFVVEDVFSIIGRGTVATGQVQKGVLLIGEEIILKRVNTGEVRKVKIVGIEMFRRLLTEAKVGDNVGLLIANIKRGEISRGDILYK